MRSNINIYNEDCMKAMKDFADNAFDLAIVDPPYGLGQVNFSTHNKHKDKGWNKKIPTKEYFTELHRVSKNQIIWGCNYYYGNIKSVGRIIHDKLIPKHGLQTFSDCDLASNSLEKRIIKFTYEWRGNVQGGKINWDNSGIDGRIHPTQKPVQLYKWLLQNYAKEGDKILDTHLGSGSIAIACWDLCFDLTAYEIDTEYYIAARTRLKNHQSQGQLF